MCAVASAPGAVRVRGESGPLCHGDGAHGRGDRCRRSFVSPILSSPGGAPPFPAPRIGPGPLTWSWSSPCCVSAALIRLALQCLISSDYC